MLVRLINSPSLASHVQELSHRCHLDAPDPWMDVANGMLFTNGTFSIHSTIRCLLRRAVKNMINVHTLRFVLGHQNVVEEILLGYFGQQRSEPCHIRRLWIESSTIPDLEGLSFQGCRLESIRCRRMWLGQPALDEARQFFLLARKATTMVKTGTYQNTMRASNNFERPHGESEEECYQLEDAIYKKLSDKVPTCKDPECFMPTLRRSSNILSSNAITVLSGSTLTSLVLDWTMAHSALVKKISDLTFPKLRAFQVRNAVTQDSELPREMGLYLFDHIWLAFLERHPLLQCIAWPMQHFLPDDRALTSREHSIVSWVCGKLVELRIDSPIVYPGSSEDDFASSYSLTRLWDFAKTVAPLLTSLQSLKVEGSIPYAIKYSLLQALHASPLRKVVVIGVLFPVKYLWSGLDPADKGDIYRNKFDVRNELRWIEDEAVSSASLRSQIETLSISAQQVCAQTKLPFLKMLAHGHTSSITTLKFCGFYGAPVLHHASQAMHREFSHLGQYHSLTNLTSAFWIIPYHNGRNRSRQILDLWEARQKNDIAAVREVYELTDGHFSAEERVDGRGIVAEVLEQYWEPAQLATEVSRLVGPHLSAQALARNDGITVRALFLLRGRCINDLYEMDVEIGVDRSVRRFLGPRGEKDPDKLQEKMQDRAWF